MFKTKLPIVAGTLITVLSAANSSSAVTINYTDLTVNTPIEGVVASGDNTDNPNGWDYYRFSGSAGQRLNLTLTARRINQALDPAFGVWEGTASDTSEFVDIFSDGNTLSQIVFADDEIPNPGPFGDPTARLRIENDGFYTVGVTSFLSDPTSEPLAYRVPEPMTVLGSLAALGMGVALKRKYNRQAG